MVQILQRKCLSYVGCIMHHKNGFCLWLQRLDYVSQPAFEFSVATRTRIRGLREGMCVTSSCTLGHQKLPPYGLHELLPSRKLPKMLRSTAACKLKVAEPRQPGFQMIAWCKAIPTDPSSQSTVTAEGNFREPWIWASTCCRGRVHPCQNMAFPIFRLEVIHRGAALQAEN